MEVTLSQGTVNSWKLWSAHQEVEDGVVLGDDGHDGDNVHTYVR
jgi:hypothetical protein